MREDWPASSIANSIWTGAAWLSEIKSKETSKWMEGGHDSGDVQDEDHLTKILVAVCGPTIWVTPGTKTKDADPRSMGQGHHF